jgi:hypothetical protein
MTAVLALSASCTLSARHPLTDEKTSKIDERLIGDWVMEGSEKEIWRVRRRPATKNSLELTLFEATSDKEHGPSSVHTTVIGEDHYMTLEDIDPQSGRVSCDISRYAWIDDDTIQAFPLDKDRIAEAIAAGELEGEITKRSWLGATVVAEVLVTGSPESIARYLKKHGKKAFPVPRDNDLVIRFKRKS